MRDKEEEKKLRVRAIHFDYEILKLRLIIYKEKHLTGTLGFLSPKYLQICYL